MTPLQPHDPRHVGPYRTLAALGGGGMGRVLLAAGPDGRPAAVKLVHDSLARKAVFRERFRREIAACRLVSGAYTAPVLGADPDAPTPWLATLYVPGPSLQQVVTDGGPLPAASVHRLAVGLATALADIHRAGLVHRDLKPSNVLLAHDGPRVIDFGIARAVEDDVELTGTDSVIGSPEYMSPEQAHGHALTAATDLFSLGTVLVFAATGTNPFAGSSAVQALYNVVHAEPDLRGVPEPLRDVVAACLARAPERRPTPEELLDRLVDIAAVEPGTAPWPYGVHERISTLEAQADRILTTPPAEATPTRARRRLLVGVAAVLAVTGVLTTIGLAGGDRTLAGHASPGEGPAPRALPADGSADGTDEEPEDVDPLSRAGLRSIDPCKVLADESDLVPQIGVHLSACTYEHDDGRWFALTLGDHVPGDPDPSDEVQDDTLDGLWLVVDEGGEGRCEVGAILDDQDITVSVDVDPGVGDVVDKPCTAAHERLATALDVIQADAPERDPLPGSFATTDPCALIETSEVEDVFSTTPTVTPEGLHSCEWDVGGVLTLDLGNEVDPAKLPDTWTKDELGEHTVYQQTDAGTANPPCALSWAHLTNDDSLTQVVRLRYRPHGSTTVDACEAARSVATLVLERLPQP
ncbi:protein kinase domain-containing protein [Saccharomonospora azurea]